MFPTSVCAIFTMEVPIGKVIGDDNIVLILRLSNYFCFEITYKFPVVKQKEEKKERELGGKRAS